MQQSLTYFKSTVMQIWKSANICLRMIIICWRFHIKAPFTFCDMHTWDIWKVGLQTFRSNRICSKLAYLLRNLQTSRANHSRILRIRNAKFSGYCFYMSANTRGDFQICISVPLNIKMSKYWKKTAFWCLVFHYTFQFCCHYILNCGVNRCTQFFI